MGRRLPEDPAELKLFLDGWISDIQDIPSGDLPEMFRRGRIRTEFFTSRAVVGEWDREIESRRDALRNKQAALPPAPSARLNPVDSGQKVVLSLPDGRICSFNVRIFEELRGSSPRRTAQFSEGSVNSGPIYGEVQPVLLSGGVVRSQAACPVHGPFEARVLVIGKSAHLSGCLECLPDSGKRLEREYVRQNDGKLFTRTFCHFEQNDHGRKTTYVRYSEWEECPVG